MPFFQFAVNSWRCLKWVDRYSRLCLNFLHSNKDNVVDFLMWKICLRIFRKKDWKDWSIGWRSTLMLPGQITRHVDILWKYFKDFLLTDTMTKMQITLTYFLFCCVQEALRALWSATYPDQELHGLISDQWKEMGWQGRDPSTDFRFFYLVLNAACIFLLWFPGIFILLLSIWTISW